MKFIALTLVASLMLPSGLAAQSAFQPAINRAIAHLAPEQTSIDEGPVRRPGMFWTGFALAGVGGLFLGDGIYRHGMAEQCVISGASRCVTTADTTTAEIGTGVAVAALGVILAVIGGRREKSAPAPLVVAPPLRRLDPAPSVRAQGLRVGAGVEDYITCAFDRAERYLASTASAADIAEAALGDCSRQYDAMRLATAAVLAPDPNDDASTISAKTKEDVRRALIRGVLEARSSRRPLTARPGAA